MMTIVFIGQQSGMMPSRSCATQRAFDLHLGARSIAVIDLEAFKLAFGIEIVEGRTGPSVPMRISVHSFCCACAAPNPAVHPRPLRGPQPGCLLS
jgi:hypothetical protein